MLVVCWLCSSWLISYKLELVVPDAVKHHTLLTHFHIFNNSKAQKPSLDLGERPRRRLLPGYVKECQCTTDEPFCRKAQSRNLMFVVSADCFLSLSQSEYAMASLLVHLYD